MDNPVAWLGSVANEEDWNHFFRVAESVPREMRNIAWLHDAVENNYDTLANIAKRFSMNDSERKALEAISRQKGEAYFDYIKRCGENDSARRVKAADLIDNLTRCVSDMRMYGSLIDRYAKAMRLLVKTEG